MLNKERRELFSIFGSIFTTEERENHERILRPPYFNDKDAFFKSCPSCEGMCAIACPEKIIKIGDDKTPSLDFEKGGCTYCDECAIVCEPEVLQIANRADISSEFTIDTNSCLGWNKTMCFSCKDVCPENAIIFSGLFKPEILQDRCRACGFCVKPCPVHAIYY